MSLTMHKRMNGFPARDESLDNGVAGFPTCSSDKDHNDAGRR
jgi:hypothetical protein